MLERWRTARMADEERAGTPRPVFVRGMQRSGTSALSFALDAAGVRGFSEGHLWFRVARLFEQLDDPDWHPNYRHPDYALGDGRDRDFAAHIAGAIDDFHRAHLPKPTWRWADKSPGFDAVDTVPGLSRLFPEGQYILLYRNGISTVNSGLRFWPENPAVFEIMCEGWSSTLQRWRAVRGQLDPTRVLELAQEEMALRPERSARRLAEFLGRPDRAAAMASVIGGRRVLSSFPDRAVGDYAHGVDWDEERKATFRRVCGRQMAKWGYEIDFDAPGPPGWLAQELAAASSAG